MVIPPISSIWIASKPSIALATLSYCVWNTRKRRLPRILNASPASVARRSRRSFGTFPAPLRYAMVLAGHHVLCGGDQTVVAYDSKTGKECWQAEVEGKAYALAVAGNRLVCRNRQRYGPLLHDRGRNRIATAVEAKRTCHREERNIAIRHRRRDGARRVWHRPRLLPGIGRVRDGRGRRAVPRLENERRVCLPGRRGGDCTSAGDRREAHVIKRSPHLPRRHLGPTPLSRQNVQSDRRRDRTECEEASGTG